MPFMTRSNLCAHVGVKKTNLVMLCGETHAPMPLVLGRVLSARVLAVFENTHATVPFVIWRVLNAHVLAAFHVPQPPLHNSRDQSFLGYSLPKQTGQLFARLQTMSAHTATLPL